MVSLEDEKSKELANVISNDTSRRILSFLSEHEASESEIGKALNLPASTVHYNVQHLLKNNLIEVKDFYWSDKGNRVNVYTIAKKLIVIAPRGAKFTSAVKGLIPVALFSLAAAAIIHFASRTTQLVAHSSEALRSAVPEAAKDAAIRGAENMTAPLMSESQPATTFIVQPSFWSNYAVWFVLGAFFAILIYLIIYLVTRKK
ncbi:MAG: winged helix-turn-helix domain-containing protein [Candidatus Nanoarchaeia archaeon]